MPTHTEIKEKKAQFVNQYGANDKDTGRAEVQVAVLTDRINGPTEHFKTHKGVNKNILNMQIAGSQKKQLLLPK